LKDASDAVVVQLQADVEVSNANASSQAAQLTLLATRNKDPEAQGERCSRQLQEEVDAGNAKARQLNAAAGEVQELQRQLRAEKEGCSSMASSLTANLKSSDTRTRELETHVGDLRRELDVSDRQGTHGDLWEPMGSHGNQWNGFSVDFPIRRSPFAVRRSPFAFRFPPSASSHFRLSPFAFRLSPFA